LGAVDMGLPLCPQHGNTRPSRIEALEDLRKSSVLLN
jgi:hypothetical protein